MQDEFSVGDYVRLTEEGLLKQKSALYLADWDGKSPKRITTFETVENYPLAKLEWRDDEGDEHDISIPLGWLVLTPAPTAHLN